MEPAFGECGRRNSQAYPLQLIYSRTIAPTSDWLGKAIVSQIFKKPVGKPSMDSPDCFIITVTRPINLWKAISPLFHFPSFIYLVTEIHVIKQSANQALMARL